MEDWDLETLERAWAEFLTALVGFLPRLFIAAAIFLVGLLAAKFVPRPIKTMLSRTRLDPVAAKYVLRVLKILIWGLTLMMILDLLGFPVTSLLTLLAAVGAAVALAIKDNLSNLASGVVLLFTKPFKAGDYVEVDGAHGVIREIELMHTYLDTMENIRVAIPNTKMMTATITNYSAHDIRRQDLVFSVGYEEDLEKAMAVVLDVAMQHPLILHEPEEPMVRVKEHASSSVQLLLRVWTAKDNYWNAQFDLIEKVKLAFDENNIDIPYPQLDVHRK